ncbi:MAG: hypothetical protein ACK4UP_11285, partial [Spirosomataceae bacterium]
MKKKVIGLVLGGFFFLMGTTHAQSDTGLNPNNYKHKNKALASAGKKTTVNATQKEVLASKNYKKHQNKSNVNIVTTNAVQSKDARIRKANYKSSFN